MKIETRADSCNLFYSAFVQPSGNELAGAGGGCGAAAGRAADQKLQAGPGAWCGLSFC